MSDQPVYLNPQPHKTRPVRPKPTVPDHELLHRIGEGAYGEVWLARNVLGAYRAVKVVHRGNFQDERPYEREYHGIERFEPISRTHEGLVAVLQVGRSPEDDYFYYVMELADSAVVFETADVSNDPPTAVGPEGETAQPNPIDSPTPGVQPATVNPGSYVPRTLGSDLRQQGRLSAQECARLGISVTLALGHLHRHGLIHRDVKPSNIIFVKGLPKLADIGLVAPLTDAHSLVGTEGFMPPEGPTSPQADLYSLGKVLYEASMGRDRHDFPEPFTGLRQEPDAEPLLELNAVVLKACAPDTRDRYTSAEDMHVDLALVHGGKSVKRKQALERRVKVLMRGGGLAAAVALLAIGGLFFEQRLRQAEAGQRRRAERTVKQLELQRVHGMFAAGQAPGALAKLAGLLRQDPTNRMVVEQVLAVLAGRDWPLPTARLGHAGYVDCVRRTADGKRAVTGSHDGTACVWDIETGERAGPPMKHDEAVQWALPSPSGKLVVTAAGPHVRVWDWLTGQPITEKFTQAGPVSRAELSPDHSRLLVVAGREALLLDARTGDQLCALLTHQNSYLTAEFSPDGNKVATSAASWSGDELEVGTGQVWDAHTGARLAVMQHPRARIWIARFSPDGRRLFTGSSAGADNAGNARLWDTETGALLAELIGHTHTVRQAEFSPDGSRLITGATDRTACIWEVETGRLLLGPWEYPAEVDHVAFSKDGKRVFTGTRAIGTWHLRDAETGLPLTEARYGPYFGVLELAPDGERVVGKSGDAAWVLDLRPARATPLVLEHEDFVTFAQFGPNGQLLVTTTDVDVANGRWTRTVGGRKGESEGRSARVWEVASGRLLTPPLEHDDGILCADFNPDGTQLITGSRDQTARVWDSRTGKLQFTLPHDVSVRSVRFSPDGQWIFTSCWRNDGWLWGAKNGQLLRRLRQPETGSKGPEWNSDRFRWFGPIQSGDIGPDGQWVVTGSVGYPPFGESHPRLGARVWNVATGEMLPHVYGSNEVRMARFSPDGRTLAATSQVGYTPCTAQVWEVQTGKALTDPLAHEDQVYFAQFSPDGNRLLTGSQDRTARIWDARTGEQLTESLPHKGEVVYGEFSPDGERVVTASWWDHAAFLWDSRTGLLLGEPLQHDDWVTYATFSPDGRWVVTTSCDGTAKIWEVPMATAPAPDWLADLAEAVGGQRIDDQGVSHQVPLDDLWELRSRLLARAETDSYTLWAKWFFADRSTRAISPNTPLILKESTPPEKQASRRVLEAVQE